MFTDLLKISIDCITFAVVNYELTLFAWDIFAY